MCLNRLPLLRFPLNLQCSYMGVLQAGCMSLSLSIIQKVDA